MRMQEVLRNAVMYSPHEVWEGDESRGTDDEVWASAPSAFYRDLYNLDGRIARIDRELDAWVWLRWALVHSDAILRERLACCMKDYGEVEKTVVLECRTRNPCLREMDLLDYVLRKRAAGLPVEPTDSRGQASEAAGLREKFDNGESAGLAAVRELRARPYIQLARDGSGYTPDKCTLDAFTADLVNGGPLSLDKVAFLMVKHKLHPDPKFQFEVKAADVEEIIALALSPLPLKEDIIKIGDWEHFREHEHVALENRLWCYLCKGTTHRRVPA